MGEEEEVVDGKKTGRYILVKVSQKSQQEYEADIVKEMRDPARVKRQREFINRMIKSVEGNWDVVEGGVDEEDDGEDAENEWEEAEDEILDLR